MPRAKNRCGEHTIAFQAAHADIACGHVSQKGCRAIPMEPGGR
jgi:hypothetical protein